MLKSSYVAVVSDSDYFNLCVVADPTSLPNVQNVDRLKLKLAEFIS